MTTALTPIRLVLACVCSLSGSCQVAAASLSDPVVETPKGSVFKLRSELEIPANRDFILLGRDRLVEFQNDLSQTLNREAGRYNYLQYRSYQRDWIESVSQTYVSCLERHRVYYKNYDDTGSNTVILNQGRNNTNIVINNSPQTPQYGSYIGNNPCIKPEHTMAFLLIDADESQGGGVFRSGYEFSTKGVDQRISGHFHIVTIKFDHDIVKGIRILTTQSPEAIAINAFQYSRPGKGFWGGLGSALAGMTHLGGNLFSIELPEKQYYE